MVRNHDFETPTDDEIAAAFGVDDVDDITDEMLDDVDVSPPAYREDTLDLSDYDTAHGAAKATHRKVAAIAEELGHDPDTETFVEKRGGAWVVSYEAGPYEWALKLTMGRSVFGGDDPCVTGFYGADGWSVECEYSFALGFYPTN